MRLTDLQLRRFHDDGFLIVRDFFPREQLQPVIEWINRVVDDLAERLYAKQFRNDKPVWLLRTPDGTLLKSMPRDQTPRPPAPLGQSAGPPKTGRRNGTGRTDPQPADRRPVTSRGL